MKLKRYTKLVAFRATSEEKEKLSKISLKLNLTEGEVLRGALEKYLKAHVPGLEKEEDIGQKSDGGTP